MTTTRAPGGTATRARGSRRRPEIEVVAIGPPLLEMRGVSKSFSRGPETVVALREVDLALRPGELVALVGPSGSGKSTLLHLAAGLDAPDRGTVLVGDQDLSRLTTTQRAQLRRRRIGFVFQFFHLLPTLTVAENVALPLLFDRPPADARQAAADVLDRVGLGGKLDRHPAELSGGEMQRTAVARALVATPELVLADEPTGNLDSASGAAVLDLLTAAVRDAGATLLLVTHDAAAAGRADRVLTLRDGRVSEGARVSEGDGRVS